MKKKLAALAVESFDSKKYTGHWYEIARIDYRFEKNLKNTTAEYSINPNGSIKVVNRGYNFKKQKWEQATGKAKFAGDPSKGALKVSFFGPFYSPYNVIAIDPEYNYALVAGKNFDYLWLLSRTTTIPESIKSGYLQKAAAIGYDIQKLTWVQHDEQGT